MPVTSQLLVNLLKIREWGTPSRCVRHGRKQSCFDRRVIQVIGEGPVQVSDLRPLKVVGNAAVRHRTTAGDLADRKPQSVP
jgi:hypothetical protein